MPTATYQDLLQHLTEVADPPVPTRTTSLAKPTGPVQRKHKIQCIGLAVICAVPSGAAFYYGHWIVGGVFGFVPSHAQ